jgi:transposase InsO family protein
MPWKEHRKMSLKMEFVEKASRPGVRMAELCRQYGIARETGYKWLNRFKQEGYVGLEEKSRAPHSSPLMKAEELVQAVLMAREAHPRWGPKKLHGVVRRRFGDETPSESTIARVLRRFGQVRARRARRPLSTVERAPEVAAHEPNDVWTVDFKGWWRSLDGYRCEPLTVRDSFSRYVLAVEVLATTAETGVRPVFERLFRKHGLPSAIQCDNGTPFISVRGRGGLTKLSAWWISLGIKVVRSRPGCPQDNGGHERMHRDMRADLQAHPSPTLGEQQRACNKWQQEFNHVRPHEALQGKVPAEFYKPSIRRSLDQPKYKYPEHWIPRRVYRAGGVIALEGQQYQVSKALADHVVALEPLAGLRHRIWFRDLDLGEIELAPPRRLIDSVADAFLERPFRKSSNPSKSVASPSAQETLDSSVVSSAAPLTDPA